MKRFVAVLAGVLTLPAFADDVLLFREELTPPDVASRGGEVSDTRNVKRGTSTQNRSGISRAVPSSVSSSAMTTANRNAASGRVIAAGRAGVATPSVSARKTATREGAVVSRNVGGRNVPQTSVVSRVAAPVASRVRARAATMTTNIAKASDGGISVNNSSDDTTVEAAATPASVTSAMESVAALTSFCKAQYTECMDNFCNVLDDNQGRCSCSKNIKNYEKTENALKAATEALQDVAQQIQYIGLSKDEIDTLFSQTEAELAMQATTDNSQLKNDLDKIKGLIVQVKSGTASSTEIDSGLSMDLSGLMNFNISSAGFDLGALFGGQSVNTNSISNQRGEQLYKTAAARCRTAVLNDCQSQGVDISIVSNAYDMEIDKQCVAYERSLTDANDEMVQTVRNAKSVLQRARLMVAQQKNSYDLRGCINALDSCMQDDFVCGNDYENCLDPSGKYIVDGAVVIGSMPGQAVPENMSSIDNLNSSKYSVDGLYSTWNYTKGGSDYNVWGPDGKVKDGGLAEYISETLTVLPTDVGTTLSEFLQYKIGYIQKNKSYGMCSSVLNKCQDYTYVNDEYSPKNRVIEEYLTRTLVKIKTAQDRILSDYAETCIADVSSCLSENNYNDDAHTSTQSKIAINACRSQILTCMSVNGNAAAEPTPAGMAEWVFAVMDKDTGGTTGGTTTSGSATSGSATSGSGKDACQASNGVWTSSSCTCPTGHMLNRAGYCYISGIEGFASCSAAHGEWISNASVCFCTGAGYIGSACATGGV